MQQFPLVRQVLDKYKGFKQVTAEVRIWPIESLLESDEIEAVMSKNLSILESMAKNHKLVPIISDDPKVQQKCCQAYGPLAELVEFLLLLLTQSQNSRIKSYSPTGLFAEDITNQSSSILNIRFEVDNLDLPCDPITIVSVQNLNWQVEVTATTEIPRTKNLLFSRENLSIASKGKLGKFITTSCTQKLLLRELIEGLQDNQQVDVIQPSMDNSSLKMLFSINNPYKSLVSTLNHQEQNLRFNTITSFRIRETIPKTGEVDDHDQITLATLVSSKLIRNRCLLFKPAHFDKWSVRELSNLFTNYGNIDRVVYNVNTDSCLFVYSCSMGVQNAVTCLSGINLLGFELILVSDPSDDLLESNFQKELIAEFIPRKRFVTSETGLPNIVNPVSKTIHVTFYSEEVKSSLSDLQLIQIFSQISPPVRLKRESGRRKKNMWFAEFESAELALKVLMLFHNRDVSGGAIRLSFTKNLA
jgi:hypothetical protein